MSGEPTEVILAKLSTVSIDGAVYNMKRLWSILKDAPVIRDVNSDNSDYTFGGRNHGFDATIEATTPDLPTLDALSDPAADGDYSEVAVVVTMPPTPKGGLSAITATFNAKLPHGEIGHPNDEGVVLVRVSGPITSKTITWA